MLRHTVEAKRFYKSKAWQKCRTSYIESVFGLCERCKGAGKIVHHKVYINIHNINDPDVTLNHRNLELLCHKCHNKEHFERFSSIQNGLQFDGDGNLIEKKNVFIVWGAPGSGKTTYVRDNKRFNDIVIDLDYLMSALSLTNERIENRDALPFVLDIRDLLYRLIANREHKFNNAWVIATLPEAKKRRALQKRLRAELIYIESTLEECIERVENDDSRLDKAKQREIVHEFFEKLELE